MRNRLFLSVLFFSIIINCFSIGYLKKNIPIEALNDKGINISYHQSQIDYQLYGSKQWAVLFDFTQWFPSDTTTVFQASGVAFYSEVPVDTCKVYICESLMNQPGAVLEEKLITQVNAGWNEFNFTNIYARKKVWIVIDYSTSANGPYMSASLGTGKNSYYRETANTGSSTIGSCFYNFYETGLQAELLVSLKGSFSDDVIDLQLNDFSFNEAVSPRSEVKPIFSITNNSSTPISNISLHISATSPGLVMQIADSLYITDRLNPYETYSYDGSGEYSITFPELPTQVSFTVRVKSESDDKDNDNNNIKSFTINSFSKDKGLVFFEEFIQSFDQTSNELFLTNNSNLNDNEFLILTYFPDLSDTLNTNISFKRNQFYKNFGYPNSVIDGQYKVSGYLDTYRQSILDKVTFAKNSRTFLDLIHFELHQNESNLDMSFVLVNSDTKLSTAYLAKCNVNVYILEKFQYLGRSINSISNQLTSAATPITLFDLEQGYEKQITLSIPFDQIFLKYTKELNNNMILVTVQDQTTNEILCNFTSVISGIDFTQDSAPVITQPDFSIYPNPIQSTKILSIKSENQEEIQSLELFNIKGQKIRTYRNEGQKTQLKADISKLSSGLYLCRIKYSNGKNHGMTKIKPIVIVK